MKKSWWIAVCLATSIASADAMAWDKDFWGFCPYAGMDAQYRNMPFRKGYGNKLFGERYFQGNIYIGARYSCNLGLELGYENGSTLKKESTLYAGDMAAGSLIEDDCSPATFQTKAQLYGPHIDLVAYYPISCFLNHEVEALGSFGLVALKEKFERRTISLNGISRGTIRNFVAYKFLPRIMIGLQYKLMDCVGIRGTVGWEDTSRLGKQANNTDPLANNPSWVRPHDSLMGNLGVIFSF